MRNVARKRKGMARVRGLGWLGAVAVLVLVPECKGQAGTPNRDQGDQGRQGPVERHRPGAPARSYHSLRGLKVSKVLREAEENLRPGWVGYGWAGPAHGPAEDDKTLAPYFYVAGGDPNVDRLPLKETRAEVTIAGVIARVKVYQIFENHGSKPIEAVYVFPGSTRAAVHGMRMKIGERTIQAKIEERKRARKQYEQAKQQGKRASLLEQQRPNVFTMNVANIMPGDRIEVRLDYTELLVPEDSLYEFVYPTVVGPRYPGGADRTRDRWIANPYLRQGQKEPYKFDITLHLKTGIPLKEVSSPSHKVRVDYRAKDEAVVHLGEEGGGNRDFVLRYRLADDKVESGLLTYRDRERGEGFFLIMMEPPVRPTPDQVPPREYIFVLDVSGSMRGFPLETAKALMRELFKALRPIDRFNVVLFSGSAGVLNPSGSLQATEENLSRALALIDGQGGGGSTELLEGLKAAYGIPPSGKGVSRTVVVVTDGYVAVEAQAFSFIRRHLDEANLFAFGIGTGVNRYLIEGMARAGLGEPFVVLGPAKTASVATRFRKYIEAPVLTGITVSFKGIQAYDVAPEAIPDLLASRPLVIYGKFAGAPAGNVVIKGLRGSQEFRWTLDFSSREEGPDTRPIMYLWARKWVQVLEDRIAYGGETPELKQAVTALGLGYDILTSFTSFVAIDSEVVNKGGSSQAVRQPLPLPAGVTDHAVGAKANPDYRGTGGVLGRAKVGRGKWMAVPARQATSPLREDEKKEGEVPTYVEAVKWVGGSATVRADLLARRVYMALKKGKAACLPNTGRVVVELSIDGTGTITKVRVVGTHTNAVAGCLHRLLASLTVRGLVTKARPAVARLRIDFSAL